MTTVTAQKNVVDVPKVGRPERKADARRGARKLAIHGARAALVVGFLALWEVAAREGWIDPRLFGQPSGVWTALWDYLPSERHFNSLQSTGTALALAFVIGSFAGTTAGLILGLSPTLDAIIGPLLTPINTIPRIALAPVFIAWFGLTTTAKVVLAVSIVFFILAENARSAVRSVDFDLMTMARVVGLRRSSLVMKVILPSAVPTIFAGLRLTFTYSLLGVIASEMIAATAGLGQDIVLFSSMFQINTTFAILVEIVFFAMLVTWAFAALERRLLRWQR